MHVHTWINVATRTRPADTTALTASHAQMPQHGKTGLWGTSFRFVVRRFRKISESDYQLCLVLRQLGTPLLPLNRLS